MWDICGETFISWTELALHAETHALSAIHCAYQGTLVLGLTHHSLYITHFASDCDGVFESPRELVAHNLGHAEKNTVALLPSARPSAPKEPMPLPPVLESVPVWGALAPAVQMPDIPKERHMTLGPWVSAVISASPQTHANLCIVN
jgi:hypothetical protein